ncbi:MAG: hypothetical protein JNL55_00400, partial [Steroidobacter sp.]|nr:hypothetical protein [Steroidobacter sp.]
MTEAPDRGWQRCVRVDHAGLRLVVTLEVGPRIIECSLDGGANLFKEFEQDMGRTSGDEYLLFGGHRLWHAPEAYPRSYGLDFEPVEFTRDGSCLRFTQREEPSTRIQKSIAIEFLAPHRVHVSHELANRNPWAVELAPWAMTLLAAGSRLIVPQEEFRPHPQFLDPARTLTLWPYTRMNDPRVLWGERFIQLQEDGAVDQKFKLGVLNRQCWAACWVNGWLLIKTFSFDAQARYADLGCNCEFFTMPGFVEMETLGPLTRVEPQQRVAHSEVWHFWSVPSLP